MKRWKAGIVGLSRGRGFVTVFNAHPDVAVTAVCDIDHHRVADVGDAFELPDAGRFTDFDAFVDADMDIVIVSTPIPLHTEHTVRSLEAGKHVLCEQTVAYTVDECSQVVDAVRRSGRHYMMAENYCYYHYIREWKKIVEAGRLGEIVYAEGEYMHDIVDLLVDENGGYFWRHERPPIWYCAHTLGPVLMLMNDRIVRACGVTTGFNAYPEYRDHPGFLDFELGLFRTEKGAIVRILRSQVPACPHFVWYSLYGTQGHLENRRARGEGHLYIRGETQDPCGDAFTSDIVDPNAPEEARGGGHGTSEYYMIRDFLDALAGNTAPPIDVLRATEWTIPGIIAHESAMKNGVWMDVPRLG